MKLSVIMPAYNEAGTIREAISRVVKQKLVAELIVINDGSTDNTSKIIQSIKSKKLKTIDHPQNLGKGAAVKTGIEEARFEYILINDSDLEYDPKEIPNLVDPIIQQKAEVVYGSRFTGPRRNMFFWHSLGNKFLSFLVNLLFNTTLSDMETCYKLMPTKLARDLKLTSDDFTIEPEITCKILKKKNFIYEVPISYTGRTYDQGKKITWIDGLKALKTIIWQRITS